MEEGLLFLGLFTLALLFPLWIVSRFIRSIGIAWIDRWWHWKMADDYRKGEK